MDIIKANGIENIQEKISEWTREQKNQAQESIIQKLEEALNFLKKLQIKNEESLVNTKKCVDDLLSSLKYLPIEPSFDILPTEIKTDILGYLCETGSFVAASVCQEWKEILKPSLKKVDAVIIGKHCSNWFECENNKCFMPEEILKASITLKLDIPITVCYPLIDIDSELIIQGLSSVSSLNLNGLCSCMDNEGDDFEFASILTMNEVSDLFRAFEEKNVKMDLELRVMEVLNQMDQNTLVDHLLNQTWRLTLDEGPYFPMLDVPSFVGKLLDDSKALLGLTLHHFAYGSNLSVDVADALCNVLYVNLEKEFHLKTATAKRLIQNILTRPVIMRGLTIEKKVDWGALISPNDLKSLLNKMKVVRFVGTFTPEQRDAAKSLPGVEASLEKISKGLF